MTILSVKELDKKSLERAKVNHDTYRYIYDLCASQIRRQNDAGNTQTIYTIPAFVIGRTPYTHSHAIRYTVEKLERGGFHVTPDPECPAMILIDWDRQTREQETKKKTSKTRKKKSNKKNRKVSGQKKIEEPLSVRIARLQSTSIMNA
jgi:hypothetical protein